MEDIILFYWSIRRRSRRADVRTHRLRVESLEDRRMLAPIIVNSWSDSGDDANTTLREAIAQANVIPDFDTFQFASSVYGQTITIAGGNFVATERVTITGPIGAANRITIPSSLTTNNVLVSEFPSGNGYAGGEFNFVATLLPSDAKLDFLADLNGDWNVDELDAIILFGNRNLSNPTQAQGDLDGDGDIDIHDLDLVFAQYGLGLVVVS